MHISHLTDVPDQGQLVEVRRRHFVVTEVERSSLLPALSRPGIWYRLLP